MSCITLISASRVWVSVFVAGLNANWEIRNQIIATELPVNAIMNVGLIM